MSRLLLSGPVIRPRPKPPAGLILVVVILIACAYALYAYQHHRENPENSIPVTQSVVPTPVPPPAASDEEIEDALLHMAHVRQNLMHIQESLNQVRARIRQVRPSLNVNFMTMQNQRLEIADRASESGLRDTAQALEEIEILKSNIQQRRK